MNTEKKTKIVTLMRSISRMMGSSKIIKKAEWYWNRLIDHRNRERKIIEKQSGIGIRQGKTYEIFEVER